MGVKPVSVSLCVQAEQHTSFGQPALFELRLGDFIQPKKCEILDSGGNIFSETSFYESLCTSSSCTQALDRPLSSSLSAVALRKNHKTLNFCLEETS